MSGIKIERRICEDAIYRSAGLVEYWSIGLMAHHSSTPILQVASGPLGGVAPMDRLFHHDVHRFWIDMY